MHILVLATTYPVETGDGTPRFVADLANELSRSNRVTVVAPRVPARSTAAPSENPQVVRFPYFPGPWERLAGDAIMPTLRKSPWRVIEVPPLVFNMWRTARDVCRDNPVDVVSAHWTLPAGWIASRLRRRFGVPYAVTLHGADAFLLTNPILRYVKARIFARAASLLPVSSDIAESARLNRYSNVHIVPMGTQPLEGNAQQMRDAKRFLFVGRLVPKKGIDIALRAIAMTQDAELTVVGSGPELPSLQQLAWALKLEERVQFTGNLTSEAVTKQLRSATAVLLPSRIALDGDKDGMPVVLAEAHASGTPAICSDVGGITEQVRHLETAFLVEPESPQALFEALAWAMANPDRLQSIGETARNQFPGSALDIRQTGRDYLRILDGIRR